MRHFRLIILLFLSLCLSAAPGLAASATAPAAAAGAAKTEKAAPAKAEKTDKAAGAVALTVFCTCGVISNIIGGLLSDRYGCIKIIRLAFVLMAPVVFAFSLAGNLYAAYALLPFLGFVLYAPFSSLVVLGQKLLARNIGFASGVTLGLATSMGGMAAPCLGWIADNYGLPRAIQCLGLVALLGMLFAFLLSSSKAPVPARGAAA